MVAQMWIACGKVLMVEWKQFIWTSYLTKCLSDQRLTLIKCWIYIFIFGQLFIILSGLNRYKNSWFYLLLKFKFRNKSTLQLFPKLLLHWTSIKNTISWKKVTIFIKFCDREIFKFSISLTFNLFFWLRKAIIFSHNENSCYLFIGKLVHHENWEL